MSSVAVRGRHVHGELHLHHRGGLCELSEVLVCNLLSHVIVCVIHRSSRKHRTSVTIGTGGGYLEHFINVEVIQLTLFFSCTLISAKLYDGISGTACFELCSL